MMDFKNKKVLITGGSRGIGKACVEMFARAGAQVAFTYNSHPAAAEKLSGSLGGSNIISIKGDLSSEQEIKSAVREAIRFLNGLDILVNNGGIWKSGRADKMSLKEWEETIKLNLTGTFLFTREVLSLMKKQRSGKIINISSTAGQRGEAFHSHYAASKGGMISFTKSLASELGKYNINVNCVAPGWVMTDMTKKELSGSSYKNEVKAIPLGRIASPEDIAGSVLFLSSDLARHITGEILNVNGGSVLCG